MDLAPADDVHNAIATLRQVMADAASPETKRKAALDILEVNDAMKPKERTLQITEEQFALIGRAVGDLAVIEHRGLPHGEVAVPTLSRA